MLFMVIQNSLLSFFVVDALGFFVFLFYLKEALAMCYDTSYINSYDMIWEIAESFFYYHSGDINIDKDSINFLDL